MPSNVAKTAAAAAMWKRLAPSLIESGRLTHDQADAFAMVCRLHAEIELLDKQLSEEGFLYMTEKGPAPNPLANLLRQSRREWVSLARDFGLTAASAARLPIMEDGDGEAQGDEEAELRAFTG